MQTGHNHIHDVPDRIWAVLHGIWLFGRIMNILVKILINADGTESRDQRWHLVDPYPTSGFGSVACTGEVFGSGIIYKIKQERRGGIECIDCINKVRKYQEVKL